jgi:hypothetical protein
MENIIFLSSDINLNFKLFSRHLASFALMHFKNFKDNYRLALVTVMLLFFCTSVASAQAPLTLSGWVVDSVKKETLPGVHVVNKSTYKGTITNRDGFFEISIKLGDTVVFSILGYQYYYFIYQSDKAPLKEVVIRMQEQNYLLEEANVVAYQLTTNKPRQIRLKKPAIPSNSQLRSDLEMLASDLNAGGIIYRMFSSKGQQLARLRTLQIEDAYRQRLSQSNNRNSVMKITGLSVNELEQFMFYCKFSPVRMHSMNDYDFLRNVQSCFRAYVKEKELESFLQQFD